MSVNVFINGCAISPADYRIKNGHVIMNQAPPAGSMFEIRTPEGASFVTVGNGSTIVFEVYKPDDIVFRELIKKISKHRQHPTIDDELKKLSVLLELIDTNE